MTQYEFFKKPIDKINTPTKSYVEQLHDYLYFHTQVYFWYYRKMQIFFTHIFFIVI